MVRKVSLCGGGPCRKIEIEEVDVRPAGGTDSQDDPKKPGAWEREISRVGKGGFMYTQTADFWIEGT